MRVSYTNVLPDKEKYYELFESTGWNKEYCLNQDQLYQAISRSWYIVSAYENRHLVGFGRIISDGTLHALIVDLMVLPSYQHKGIGSTILNKLVGKCKANAIPDIQLFCAKGKIGFYEKEGFVKRPADAPGMEINIT